MSLISLVGERQWVITLKGTMPPLPPGIADEDALRMVIGGVSVSAGLTPNLRSVNIAFAGEKPPT